MVLKNIFRFQSVCDTSDFIISFIIKVFSDIDDKIDKLLNDEGFDDIDLVSD